jgi:hypothetical protein
VVHFTLALYTFMANSGSTVQCVRVQHHGLGCLSTATMKEIWDGQLVKERNVWIAGNLT